MKKDIVILISLFVTISKAQVGINTTTPNASLEIRAENQANPGNTDGILIPKIDTFPATNPTAAQQGMMVYLTTTIGSNPSGFYYWDNSSVAWKPVGNEQDRDFLKGGTSEASTNILDNKYTLGNNGFGTTNPVRRLHVSNGISGATSSGSTGILLESNTNVYQHFLTPSTAENGILFGTDSNALGSSIIYNNVSNPDGFQFRAGGNFTRMTLTNTGNLGIGTVAPARRLHVANGASGATSNANAGVVVESNGNVFQHFLTPSTAENGLLFGTDTNSISSGLIFNNASTLNGLQFRTGGNATRMTLTGSGNLGIGIVNPLDRLHVVGNIRMVDGNQANGRVLTSDANGTASWTDTTSFASGTLDQAYDFGGVGLGRTITADAGAVTIAGTDGLVSTGTAGSGAIAPSGAGTRMVWNPRKRAFRAGNVSGTQWDDANIGPNSTAFGLSNTASGNSSVAFGSGNTASGGASAAYGSGNMASGETSLAFGGSNVASGFFSIAFGSNNEASGFRSVAFGNNNIAPSYGEVALGIGNTNYTPSTNGVTEFTIANQTDRLFVLGNAIDLNANGVLDLAERRDAMVVLKNGNIGIGNSTPSERLHVDGRTLLTNGFSADSAALLYQNNTDYMFIGPQSGSSANGAAIALFGSTNASGGNAGGLDINVPNALVRMNHTNGNFSFGTNSTSGYTGAFELNDNGFEIGHNSASRAIIFNPNNTERMRLTPLGNLGVGTNNPLQKVHVSGPAGLTAVRIANTSGTGSTSNVALDFFRNTAANTDWRIYNIGANLTIGNSGDDLATVNDLYQFQGARFMPMTDATISLGQTANRWNTLFASNGTINTSDAREKKNIRNLNYGLNALMQLRPVSFEWKKDDGSGTKLGLIAQELQQVVPEVVRDWDWEEDELGNRKKVASLILGVYYSDLIPVLIKATQEQQLVIEQQKEEIERLKQQLQEQYQALLERIKKVEEK